MSDAPVQVFVAAFPGEQDADKALKEIQAARKAKKIDVIDVAVLRRDAKNKLHIRETADMGGGRGAAIGGAVGATVGLLFPPSIIFAGSLGAVVGALAARLRDSGFPDSDLRELGEGLQPGTSAIIAVIEHRWIANFEAAMQAEGARVVRKALADDIRAQLEAGRNVVYSAAAAGGAAELSRVTGDDQTVEVVHAVVDEAGVEVAALVAAAPPEPAGLAGEAPKAEGEAPKA